MRRYELWLSNGFASSFGVGKTELLMMKTNILPRSPGVVLLWLLSTPPLPGKAYEHFVDTKIREVLESRYPDVTDSEFNIAQSGFADEHLLTAIAVIATSKWPASLSPAKPGRLEEPLSDKPPIH